MVEYESKFLDENYLRTRLNDFREFKDGFMFYRIKHSDRPTSKSIYIEMYYNGQHRFDLRVSDHSLPNVLGQIQFIITPSKVLSKKKKEQFIRMVNQTIEQTKKKEVKSQLKRIERKLEKSIDNDLGIE